MGTVSAMEIVDLLELVTVDSCSASKVTETVEESDSKTQLLSESEQDEEKNVGEASLLSEKTLSSSVPLSSLMALPDFISFIAMM